MSAKGIHEYTFSRKQVVRMQELLAQAGQQAFAAAKGEVQHIVNHQALWGIETGNGPLGAQVIPILNAALTSTESAGDFEPGGGAIHVAHELRKSV